MRKMGRSTINSACARQGKTGSRLEVEYVEDGAELIQDKMNPSLNITRIGRSIRSRGHDVNVPMSDVKSKKSGLRCATTGCKGFVEKMAASHVKIKLAECEETKRRDYVGALIFNAKTIKQMIHNRGVLKRHDEGHEDDLFGNSKSSAGFTFKPGVKQWKSNLLSKEDTSGDEAASESNSGEETSCRGRSPSGWSLACRSRLHCRVDKGDSTPERCKLRNLSPVVLRSERQRASFQLRMLKERSKTEMFPSRGYRAGHGGRSRSPWCGNKVFDLKVSAPLKQELRFEQGKKFRDMLDKVGGFSVKREQSVVSDCEDYFSEA